MKTIIFGLLVSVLAYAAATTPPPALCGCRPTHPVCGTDGVTYSSDCTLNCYPNNILNIRKKHDGACSKNHVVELSRQGMLVSGQSAQVPLVAGLYQTSPSWYRSPEYPNSNQVQGSYMPSGQGYPVTNWYQPPQTDQNSNFYQAYGGSLLMNPGSRRRQSDEQHNQHQRSYHQMQLQNHQLQ